MTNRLFEAFEKNNQAFKHRKFNKTDEDDIEKFCITIPLKNSTNLRQQIHLDEEFIKVIEQEYAVKYLERNGNAATTQAIHRLLKA